tara:strand:+ start:172 stop:450 length:279 start_codon:yes stop_codon:yes gene_type:complete
MCVGALFGGGNKPQIQPQPRQTVPPTMKAAAPPPEMVSPEKIKEEEGAEDDKLSTRKKKALEIQKVKEGVKTFGAIDPKTLPQTPAGGVNTP